LYSQDGQLEKRTKDGREEEGTFKNATDMNYPHLDHIVMPVLKLLHTMNEIMQEL
jgi:hypothetical protein